jgi:hypothetical protein
MNLATSVNFINWRSSVGEESASFTVYVLSVTTVPPLICANSTSAVTSVQMPALFFFSFVFCTLVGTFDSFDDFSERFCNCNSVFDEVDCFLDNFFNSVSDFSSCFFDSLSNFSCCFFDSLSNFLGCFLYATSDFFCSFFDSTPNFFCSV